MACRKNRRHGKVPVVLKAWEGSEAFEAALVENLQREDLNPIEEAESYQRLQEEFQLSQEKLQKRSGKAVPRLQIPCACCSWMPVCVIL